MIIPFPSYLPYYMLSQRQFQAVHLALAALHAQSPCPLCAVDVDLLDHEPHCQLHLAHEATKDAAKRNQDAAGPRDGLKYLRGARGLSEEDVAEFLGVTTRHYKRIEAGETNLSLEAAIGLARFLRTDSVENLL